MGSIIRIIIIILGILLVGSIVLLLVKRRINERHSLLWLVGGFITLVLSIAPGTLETLAELVGVDYPPTLLFLFATIAILAIALYQSIQISKLQERLTELTQLTAIQHMKNPMKTDIKEKDHAGQETRDN